MPPGKQAPLVPLRRELAEAADPRRAETFVWFFKTGPGQYGEGDQFLGITVPRQRAIARQYLHLPLTDIQRLLASKLHEHRFTALLILVGKYQASDEAGRQIIYDFYLNNTARVNNWDLVDTSAPYIVGAHLLNRPRQILYSLAASTDLWERRIAIVGSMRFLKAGHTADTFRLAKLLLADKHDLIHKAVGWALREAGKVSTDELLRFLERNYRAIPRTTFRYAIERVPAARRERLLQGQFS
jgi:3-methyladenine DNA glycosylase AlkD